MFTYKRRNQYTTNKKQEVKLIANHFQKQFNKDRSPLTEIPPTPIKTTLTIGSTNSGQITTNQKKCWKRLY